MSVTPVCRAPAKRRGAVAALLLAALAGALLPAPVLAGAQARAKPVASLAVLELTPASPADQGLAGLATEALVRALTSHAERVLSMNELRAVLDAAALQQLLGCSDERCVADLAKAIAVERLVAGRVGSAGGQRLIFLALIDPREGRVLARASHALPTRGELEQELRVAADALFGIKAARRGDRPLRELRAAVLIDELDPEGKRLGGRDVETCVGRALLDAEARLISPQQAQRIRRRVDPAAVLAGTQPEDLSAAEVDLLLVGVAQRSAGPRTKEMLDVAVENVRVDLNLQLWQVDTGEVLASEQLSGRHPGHSAREAAVAATRRLCAQVGPTLQRALARAGARGQRLVVTVQGQLSPARAQELSTAIGALARVRHVSVREVTEGRAVIDVVVAGGDGVALALELVGVPAAGTVTEAGPGALRLRL